MRRQRNEISLTHDTAIGVILSWCCSDRSRRDRTAEETRKLMSLSHRVVSRHSVLNSLRPKTTTQKAAAAAVPHPLRRRLVQFSELRQRIDYAIIWLAGCLHKPVNCRLSRFRDGGSKGARGTLLEKTFGPRTPTGWRCITGRGVRQLCSEGIFPMISFG